ncbi:WD40 repeat protein [Suhomyces tanzawaensis NRRL Y-17324]|uniref:WD40 repeat protein n=1 Tax=Suhomyces tanzawaensis NRRL Y-17324 TaxID=984487 RepID=A0A1E4SMP8_9ASCO|nr:WD40 repeat protein [Suhomyces tanzawaensis NRRL Y-17324]ODV80804.1 WD40 repeat protein [Suhomyces tanzawaensis NRRL Y-17324]
MVWVESCPENLIALPFKEPIVKLIHIAHTSLLVVLTTSSVYLINQHTLLPIASHSRSAESIQLHGKNINVKTKHVSVNTAQLQKISTVNLFVQSDKDYLVIYQILINYSTSLYEINSIKSDLTLQSGLPLSYTSKKFSLASFIKSATKTIIHGGDKASINLENIEHLNNSGLEDELGGYIVESAKISVFKMLKIKIGLDRYWLKQNSHNLIIYNGHDRKPESEEEEEFENSHFQIINIQTFKNSVLSLDETEWYHNKSKLVYINYNLFKNYFIFVNEDKELWLLHFEVSEDSEIIPLGTKLQSDILTTKVKFYFNPQSDLILISANDELSIYKIDTTKSLLDNYGKIKDVNVDSTVVTWSSCGEFFTVLDKKTGYWSLHSKFGNSSFDSYELLNELEERNDENRQFLRSSNIIISPNSSSLYLINHNNSKLYRVNLLTRSYDSKILFRDSNYISVIYKNKSFVRFPILHKFKNINNRIEGFNGSSTKSAKSISGKLTISRNKFNQFSITYGNEIAISTPLNSEFSNSITGEVNHLLWFNFKNYYSDSLNIVNHFWFNDYLILINRKFDDEYIAKEGDEMNDNEMGHLVDEIIVLNTPMSKYGNGGENFVFDSDLILWKYDFKTPFISVDPTEISHNLTNLLILTKDLRLVIIELNDQKLILDESGDASDQKNYNIFIGVNKTIHLSTISSKLNLRNITKSTIIERKHFLFLLNTGELYLLKNQSARDSFANPVNAIKPSNMYDLILINQSVESFKTQSITFNDQEIEYLHVVNAHNLLIYELRDLVLNAFDKSATVYDGIESPGGLSGELHPVSVDIDNYQPVELNTSDGLESSLQLVVVENQVLDKSTTGGLIIKPKLSHKLVLNNFIENELIHRPLNSKEISSKYSKYNGYNYCLELLLFKYLTETFDSDTVLKSLISLIELNEDAERIFINCLRKIEVGFWEPFFDVLNTSPVDFMNRLIEKGNVELCYNFLIVYLNVKKEETPKDPGYLLDSKDKQIILKIVVMLDKAKKWDWCFELCRFIKLLEPSGVLLKEIRSSLSG